MARGHRAHRWRIASRCPHCHIRLLSLCAYRTCTATRDDRPKGRHICVTRLPPRTIDLLKEARRIFDIVPGEGMGL